jgi:hypothetical protein
MSAKSALIVLAALAAIASIPVRADDLATPPAMLSGIYGRGADTNEFGFQYLWKPSCDCAIFRKLNLEPLWGVSVAYWQGLQPNNAYPYLWDFGGHGYLRYVWHPDLAFAPFVEIGLGVHALTENRINNNRELGTWFQFGSRVGVGVAFDPKRHTEVVGFIEHISNARIAEPNDGITFLGAEFRFALP